MDLNLKKKEIIGNIKHSVQKVSPRVRVLDKASEIADLVLAKEDKYSKMSMQELRNLSYRMQDEIQNGANLDNYLIDALAIARETIWRVHKMKAYRVQIIGAVVTHFGDFAEMKTGEGKTLVLLLVSYANAISKKGVHIVTVNEYLVERDMKFSEAALGELGISVGYVVSSMSPEQKKKMYACDITYVSNSELGFDYLRDNMVQSIDEKMQRGLNFAIVDEADSVLIDESRTPLIIAANPEEGVGLYTEVDKFVKTLSPNEYVIDLETHAINLNDRGIKKTESYFNIKNLYDIENSELVHKLMNALRANYIMELGKEYIIKTSKKTGKPEIALVDTFTGRVMEGRMYSAGLHQAIQAKEGVDIEPENVTVATITYQSFFRLYKKLAGLSGTALTEKNEFLNIYNMVVVDIPTNKPVLRKDQPDYIFASKHAKWKYVVAEIKRRHEKGQPVLVGTVSVEDSELLHRLLDHVGIPHTVLNAKNDSIEAEIVKKAGQKGAVTIATNMAGRGTDIKLGEGVKELGGLYVLGTERNESRRIDNQLRGRSGRQGDPGESRFFISLQDSLFKRFAGDRFDKAQFKLGEEAIDLKFFTKLLDRTQKKVESMNFDVRKNLIDYDYVLSEQRELVYKQRNNILVSNNMLAVVNKMVPRVVDVLIANNRDEENVNMINLDSLFNDIKEKIGVDVDLDKKELKEKTISYLNTILTSYIRNKLKEKYESNNPELSNNIWKSITLASLDRNWTKFLDRIQKLRDGVALRSYEQKSPLNIYVEDSDRLFYNIIINIAEEVLHNILSGGATSNNQSTELKFELKDNSNMVSIDDLELSSKVNSKYESTVEELEKENNMSSENKNKINENIDSVVEEILGGKKEEPIFTESVEKVEVIDDRDSKPGMPPPPPPIPVKKPVVENDNTKQEFSSEVLDRINSNIDTKPVDFSVINEMIEEDKRKEELMNKQEGVVPPPPPFVNQSNEVKKPDVVYERPADGKFIREDEIKYETYNHNIRMDDKENLFELDKIQRELNKEHIKMVDEKYQSVINVKDENIQRLMEKSVELQKENEEQKLEYSKQIEDIYNDENKELKQIKTHFEDLLEKKQKLEQSLYDLQMKELEKEQERMLAEKDAIILERRKLEAEREKQRQEEERRKQEELAKQKALEEERIKKQQEELAKQQALLEEMKKEQERILQEMQKQKEEQERLEQERIEKERQMQEELARQKREAEEAEKLAAELERARIEAEEIAKQEAAAKKAQIQSRPSIVGSRPSIMSNKSSGKIVSLSEAIGKK